MTETRQKWFGGEKSTCSLKSLSDDASFAWELDPFLTWVSASDCSWVLEMQRSPYNIWPKSEVNLCRSGRQRSWERVLNLCWRRLQKISYPRPTIHQIWLHTQCLPKSTGSHLLCAKASAWLHLSLLCLVIPIWVPLMVESSESYVLLWSKSLNSLGRYLGTAGLSPIWRLELSPWQGERPSPFAFLPALSHRAVGDWHLQLSWRSSTT